MSKKSKPKKKPKKLRLNKKDLAKVEEKDLGNVVGGTTYLEGGDGGGSYSPSPPPPTYGYGGLGRLQHNRRTLPL
jgi:hypothetical protein